MKTTLKFGTSALALLAHWSALAQVAASQVASGASGGGGVVVAGRPPNIVWIVGAAVIGFAVGFAVGQMRSNSSSQ